MLKFMVYHQRLWNYTKNFEQWFTVKTLKHNSTLLWIYKNKASYKKPWNYTENKGAYIYYGKTMNTLPQTMKSMKLKLTFALAN